MLSRIVNFPSSSPFKIAASILIALLVVFLILTSNTLYGKLPNMTIVFYSGVFIISLALCVLLAIKHTPHSSFLYNWCIWVIFITMVYLSIAFFNARFGSIPLKVYFGLLCIFPFLIYCLRRASLIQSLFNFFILAMTLLALLSCIAWLLGDILHLVEPNCKIFWTWTSSGVTKHGYFFVQYDLQPTTLPYFDNYIFYRNSGIFTEAPMFSFSLSCAFLLELFKRDKTRIAICIILGATILTTVSLTGIALSILAVFIKLFITTKRSAPKIILIAVFAGICVLVFAFLGMKRFQAGGSAFIRLDDFKASFEAWLQSPILGHGFENTGYIKTFMNSQRIADSGLSNSLGVVLAQGGIVYLLPNLVSLFGFTWIKILEKGKHAVTHRYDKNHLAFGICFIIMWAITIAHTLPLTALLLSLGIERILSNANLLSKHR